MKKIVKHLKLSKEEYYKKHLFIINHILPVQLTPKEVEVLAAFMALEGDIANDLFGTSGRKIVKDKLNLSAGGLGNYLDQLRTKGFITGTNKDLHIIPILIPSKKKQEYHFLLEEI